MRQEIIDAWPFFTQEILDEGRAEIARGESVTARTATGDVSIFHL